MLRQYVTLQLNGDVNKDPFEIAAVKIKNNKIVKIFHTFVSVPLDYFLNEHFGVYNEQLIGAPTLEKAIFKLQKFIGNSVLIPFYISNERALKKYLPNYSNYSILPTTDIIENYKKYWGIDEFNFQTNWENVKEIVDCVNIRNDALGEAIVIAKLFIWTQI